MQGPDSQQQKTGGMKSTQDQGGHRHPDTPNQRTTGFRYPMARGRCAVQSGPFGIGMARATAAVPPLRKPGHGRVMQSHFRVNPPNLSTVLDKTQTQLRLFARDQIITIATHRAHRIRPHQSIAATGLGRTDGGVPFTVAQAVIDRCIRKAFTPSATNYGGCGVPIRKGKRCRNPLGLHLAISIHKLHEPGIDLCQPCIARARGGKGLRHIQSHNSCAQTCGQIDAAITGPTVNINHPSYLRHQ